MSYQWIGTGAASAIVEFHDLRTESGGSDGYLRLLESGLGGALAQAGVREIGHFHVAGHPDRLLLIRGFADIAARRQTLLRLFGSPDWAANRQAVTALTRQAEVALTRAIRPAAGLAPLRPDGRYVAMISDLRDAEQVGDYHLWLRLLLRKAGLDPSAAFATLEAVNDVPAVPVVRHRSQHIALMPQGERLPELPRELRAMLRYPPEILSIEPAAALVW